MQPLKRAVLLPMPTDQFEALIKHCKLEGMDRKEAVEFIEDSRLGECWKNDTYTVLKREFHDIVHLSIKRNDQGPARDWRDFQSIKTQLLGPDEEAVEIYPAESRVVDCANQYHLWCMKGVRVPMGFGLGARRSESDSVAGFKQRPTEAS